MNMRVFLRRMARLFCVCVLLLGNAHVSFADDLTLVEAYFTRPEQYSGLIEVPGKGNVRYYAQNDPLWGGLTYEWESSSVRRPLRDAGCVPTAAAMAVANLVPVEELSIVSAYAKRAYSLCPCSVTAQRCNHAHARYVLTSQRDFDRFLPLVFADFATGNNVFGSVSRTNATGTGTGFLWDIARIYGLDMRITNDFGQAVEAVLSGSGVIATAGKGGVFTNTGHYVFLASADDERLYVLDPLRREEYKTNQGKKLEILQPGLVALTYENVQAAAFGNFIIMDRKAE